MEENVVKTYDVDEEGNVVEQPTFNPDFVVKVVGGAIALTVGAVLVIRGVVKRKKDKKNEKTGWSKKFKNGTLTWTRNNVETAETTEEDFFEE